MPPLIIKTIKSQSNDKPTTKAISIKTSFINPLILRISTNLLNLQYDNTCKSS